ncbi:RTA1 like protein-domain-containing protein [Lasiosphaeria ovina]|uniref:RTA1 like protein-domain-containing protein n=1 Tax=Lasiosphaeria ovina TaxID=92902 RepID=A0AAE0MZ70_9PEZI|nr:RTA1 like protein-domain-containing protein [Lasiosphaeria ovina]
MPLPRLIAAATVQVLGRDDGDDDSNDDCVKATPGHNGNVPVDACNSYYNYDPQVAPAVATAVIFAIFTGIHLFEAFFFKKRYTWVLIMGSLWETLAFIIHTVGAKDQQQVGYSTAWNILFLLAPLWINAFAYMTFARVVNFWLPGGRVGGLRANTMARWFVLADVVSFLIQATGGIMASPSASPDIIKTGIDIYMVGMGIQQFFILVFVALMVMFHRRCNAVGIDGRAVTAQFSADGTQKPGWRPLMYALYGVLVAITVRIIFRIAEFARGLKPENPIPFHEEYTYALDCFPMMVALLILAVFHPGRYLVGPESEFPRLSRKEKKAAKQEKKGAKRLAKEQGTGDKNMAQGSDQV